MEERIIDRDKRIKLVKTGEGTDAVDETAENAAEDEEEEFFLELPEDFDENDLTPEQTEALERARRRSEQHAREEHAKLLEDGERLLEQGKFEDAVPLFEQAALYDFDDGDAKHKFWLARTKNYTDFDVFFEEGAAQEFADADPDVRAGVLGKMGSELQRRREECRIAAEPLRSGYAVRQRERAEAFEANRKYYSVRFWAVLAVVAAFAVACAVSGAYILRVKGNTPLICCIVFAALTVLALGVFLFYAHKLYVARGYVRVNLDPAATEEGTLLLELNKKLAAYDLVFGKEEA